MAVTGSISSSKAIRSISVSIDGDALCALAASEKRLCGGIVVSFRRSEVTAVGLTVVFKSALRLSGLGSRLWGGVCLPVVAASCLSSGGTKDGLLGLSTLTEWPLPEVDLSSALGFGSRPTG